MAAHSQNGTSKRGVVLETPIEDFTPPPMVRLVVRKVRCDPILPHSRAAGRRVEAGKHSYSLSARFAEHQLLYSPHF
jgi:hypothetical protein